MMYASEASASANSTSAMLRHRPLSRCYANPLMQNCAPRKASCTHDSHIDSLKDNLARQISTTLSVFFAWGMRSARKFVNARPERWTHISPSGGIHRAQQCNGPQRSTPGGPASKHATTMVARKLHYVREHNGAITRLLDAVFSLLGNQQAAGVCPIAAAWDASRVT